MAARHVGVMAARALAAAACSLVLLAMPAPALVTLSGDGSGNTTPPADDPGFTHVGSMNGLNGVYLGNGWVITASHVGAAPSVILQGISYATVPNSWVVIEHAPGINADLGMLRIYARPPLSALPITMAPPDVGDNVTMIAGGPAREPNLTCWNSGFTEVACVGKPMFHGYKQSFSVPQAERWGRNLVTQNGFDVELSGATTHAFEVEFDDPGLAEEAQAIVGDSGGAVFIKRGAQWQLAGILFTISTYMNQPSGTAVFGDRTYSIDLSYYRTKILTQLAAPQIPLVPWPSLPLAAGVLLGVARAALSGRRPAGTAARRG